MANWWETPQQPVPLPSAQPDLGSMDLAQLYREAYGFRDVPPSAAPLPPVASTEPVPPQPGLLSDVGNLLKRGYASTAEGVNWLAGQTPGLNNIPALDWQGNADYWKQVADQTTQKLSLAQQAAGEKKFFNEDYTPGEAWKDPRSYLGGAVESIPGTVVGMAAGAPIAGIVNKVGMGLLTRGATAAAEKALAGGAEAAAVKAAGQVTNKAAGRVAMGAGAVGYGAGEGVTAAATDGAQARDLVMGRSPEEMAASPLYQQLLAKGLPPDQAQQQVADTVAEQVATRAGISVAVMGAPMGAVFGKWFHSAGGEKITKSLLGELAVGTLGEGAQEFPQSGAEQFFQNQAIKQHVDPKQKLWEGVLNASVAGSVSGAVMGGAMGGFQGIGAKAGAANARINEELSKAAFANNLQFATADDLHAAMAHLDTLGQQKDLPKESIDRVAQARSTIQAEMALRATPETLAQPLRDDQGNVQPRAESAFLGLSERPHGLSDDQLAEAANRPLGEDAPAEWGAAQDRYKAEIAHRTALSNTVKHFTDNPGAVGGVSSRILDIVSGRPLTPKGYGSTDFNLATLSDDLLTRYRMAGEVLLRDHPETLGKKQTSKLTEAVDQLHQEADRRAAGQQGNPEEIKVNEQVTSLASQPAKKFSDTVKTLSAEALTRAAKIIESRLQLEPALAPKLEEINARVGVLQAQQASVQQASVATPAPESVQGAAPVVEAVAPATPAPAPAAAVPESVVAPAPSAQAAPAVTAPAPSAPSAPSALALPAPATPVAVERVAAGLPVIYSNKDRIKEVKANPNYNVIALPDGRAKVVGVLHPKTQQWIGFPPNAPVPAAPKALPAPAPTTPAAQPVEAAQPAAEVAPKGGAASAIPSAPSVEPPIEAPSVPVTKPKKVTSNATSIRQDQRFPSQRGQEGQSGVQQGSEPGGGNLRVQGKKQVAAKQVGETVTRQVVSTKGKFGLPKSSPDGVAANAKLLPHGANRQATLVKGFDSLNRNRQRAVLGHVISVLQDDEVARSVVKTIPVDVMDMLTGKDGSSEEVLHNPSMLRNALIVPLDASIPAGVSRFIESIAGRAASASTSPAAVKASLTNKTAGSELSGKNGPTKVASKGNGSQGVGSESSKKQESIRGQRQSKQAAKSVTPLQSTATMARHAAYKTLGINWNKTHEVVKQDQDWAVVEKPTVAKEEGPLAAPNLDLFAEPNPDQFDLFSDAEPTNDPKLQKAQDGARKAVEALRTQRGSILGNAIAKDFEDHSITSLIGKKIRSAKDLAVLAQVYRNPSFETFRYFFTKGNAVVAQTATTARLPGCTPIFTGHDTTWGDGLEQLKRMMAESGADGYYILHNHPSGSPEPSAADVQVTKGLAAMLPGFKGHVVIDQTKYGLMRANGSQLVADLPEKALQDDTRYNVDRQYTRPHFALGARINSSADVAATASALRYNSGSGYFQLVGTNRHGVRGIMEVPIEALKGYRQTKTGSLRIVAEVRRFARTTGSVDIFAINLPGNIGRMSVLGAIKSGLFKDVHFAGDTNTIRETTIVGTTPGAEMGRIGSRGIGASESQASPYVETKLAESEPIVPKGMAGLQNAASISAINHLAKARKFDSNLELKDVIEDRVTAAAARLKDFNLRAKTLGQREKSYLSTQLYNEMRQGLLSGSDALGWYEGKVHGAFEYLALKHPELKFLDKDHGGMEQVRRNRFAYTYILAMTSNGTKVEKNAENAQRLYTRFLENGHLPTTGFGSGTAATNIEKSAELFNELADRFGIDRFGRMMMTQFKVIDLSNAGIKTSGETSDQDVLGALVLGPKLGNGFFANLNGIFDQLTMDRWFMRTWGRLIGHLREVYPERVNTHRASVRDIINNLTNEVRDVIVDHLTRPGSRQATKDKAKLLTAAMAPGATDEDIDALAWMVKGLTVSDQFRDILNPAGNGQGSELRLATNSLTTNLMGDIEAPTRTQRPQIREVMTEAIRLLGEHTGVNLTAADAQALLWYPEKLLYDKAKLAAGQEKTYAADDLPDYENIARQLVATLGVPQHEIDAVTSRLAGERATPDAGRSAGAVLPGPGGEGLQADSGQLRYAGFNEGERREFLRQETLRTLHTGPAFGGDNTGLPGSFKGGSPGSLRYELGGTSYDVVTTQTFNPSQLVTHRFGRAAITPLKIAEVDTADAKSVEAFHAAVADAKANTLYGAAVEPKSIAQLSGQEDGYQGIRLFMTKDGKSGFAIKKNGDIVSVFSQSREGVQFTTGSMLMLAIQEGGRKLDAYDIGLPRLYSVHGMKEVARTPFNEQYAPEDWDYEVFKKFNNGRPDIVFMVFDPDRAHFAIYGDGAPRAAPVPEYDDGVNIQQAAIESLRAQRQTANAQAGITPRLRYSKSAGGVGVSIQEARAQLINAIGAAQVQALEKAGRLVFHESDPTGMGGAGYVDSKGVIHLIPANMDSTALDVALHEAVHVGKDDRFFEGSRAQIQLAHATLSLVGLKNFIGAPSFNDLAGQVRRLAAAGNKAAQDALAKATEVDPTNVDEESVAYLSQYADAKLPLVRRILAAIRAVLYRMGVKIELRPEDIRALAMSALKARASMTTQTQRVAPAYSEPGIEVTDISWEEFSRIRNAYMTAPKTSEGAFKAWFGKGVEGVNAINGKPLTLYHASSGGYTQWDETKAGQASGHPTSGLGFFMTADAGAAARYGNNVQEFYVKISNPYYLTDADLMGLNSVDDATKLRRRLQSQGYDAGVVTAPGAAPYVIAFTSNQVKFTSNTNPTASPDFRYSLTGRPVATGLTGDRILDEFNRKAGMSERESTIQAVQRVMKNPAQRQTVIQSMINRFIEGTFDETHQGKLHELAQGIDISDPSVSGNAAQRLSTGWADTLYHILVHGAPMWRNGVVARKTMKGLFDILSPVSDPELMREWLGWRAATRADRLLRERNPDGTPKEKNFTRAEVDHVLNRINADPAKLAMFESVGVEFNQFESDMLDLAVGAGLVDARLAAQWKAHEDYLPFFREVEGKIKGPKGSRGIANQAGFKKLSGGPEELNNPLENIILGAANILRRSMANKASQLYRNNLQPTGILEKIPPAFKQVIVPAGQIKSFLKNNPDFDAWLTSIGQNARAMPTATFQGLLKMWSMQAPTDPDVIRIMDNGQANYYRVHDQGLLRALAGAERVNLGGILKPLVFFKQLLTSAVTSTPEFIARNWIRDAVHNWTINPDMGITHLMSGTKAALQNNGHAIDMGFAGAAFGGGGYVNANEPGTMDRMIKRAQQATGTTSASGAASTLFDWTSRAWGQYMEINHRFENAGREARYEQVLAATGLTGRAAFEAKDVLDFSMRGNFKSMQILTAVLPFFNARLQGLYKLGRAGALPYNRKTLLSKVVMRGAMIAMASAMLLAANKDDPRYQALNDWEKDNYWWFFFPKGFPIERIHMPKPFEVGFIYGTLIGERLPQKIMGNDNWKKLGSRFLRGTYDQLAFDPIPQAFRPTFDVVKNRVSFTGAPIEDFSDEGLLKAARYNESTSKTMRLIGEGVSDTINLSPKQLEALYRGYFGSMGMYLLAASDGVVNALTGGPRSPAWEAGDAPLLKAFLSPEVPRSTQHKTDIYDFRRDINEIYKTVTTYALEGRVAEAQALIEKNKAKLDQRPVLNSAAKMLTTVRKSMDVVLRDPDKSSAEKRIELNRLQERANTIAEVTAKMVRVAW